MPTASNLRVHCRNCGVRISREDGFPHPPPHEPFCIWMRWARLAADVWKLHSNITSDAWMNRMDKLTRRVISSLLEKKSRENTSRMDVSKKASNIHLQVSELCIAENQRILALSSVRLPLRDPKERQCTVTIKPVPSLSSLRCFPLVPSPPRKLPAPSPNVKCPYCKNYYRGKHGLATHQKSSQKCIAIRFATHVNTNTTPCPHCEMPIYKGVDGMGMIAHLIECYERIQHDQRRAIGEELLRPIRDIIERIRICLSGATLAEKQIWENTFTRWIERVDSDSTQSIRICNMVCALEEQGYLMRLPPLPSRRIKKTVKNMKITRPTVSENTPCTEYTPSTGYTPSTPYTEYICSLTYEEYMCVDGIP